MMIAIPVFAILAFATPPDSLAGSLVEAERSFCRAAVSRGIREGFLSYLDTDAVVFRPGPVAGVAVYRESKPSPAVLSWRPVRVSVARAGDIGYTTGPWVYRKNPGDSPAGFGQYVSIWRRGTGGEWKVILDAGISHPNEDTTPGLSGAEYRPLENGKSPETCVDTTRELASLMTIERTLFRTSTDSGFVRALRAAACDDIRIYRSGDFPRIGFENLGSDSNIPGAGWEWQPMGGMVSRSGDLGYTFGRSRHSGSDTVSPSTGSYLRIWKKERGQGWKVAIDLMIPAQ